ncbi:MAG: hypothetical protein ACU0B8_05300, partial [Pseudooceanicola nanhaiensis]
GKAGLAELAAMEGREDAAQLTQLIEKARSARYREEYRRDVTRADRPERLDRLAASLPIRPEGATLGRAALDGLDEYFVDRILQACDRSLPDGRPGCVLVRDAFFPNETDPQGILLLLEEDGSVTAQYVAFDSGQPRVRSLFDVEANVWPQVDREDLIRVLDGDFTVGPSSLRALTIGDKEIIPDN